VKILLMGTSHHSAPVEVRERFAVGDEQAALRKLIESDDIEEAVLVSTCNRVEVVVTTRQPGAARHTLQRFFRHELAGESPLPGQVHLDDVL